MQVEPEAARASLQGHYAVPFPVLCDPSLTCYRRYGLWRANWREILSPRVVGQAMATTLRGHFIGREQGDGFLMPGVFAIARGGLIAAARYPRDAADNPSTEQLLALIRQAAEKTP